MTFQTFEEALQYIESLQRFKIMPGLERIEKVLSLLGNPHNQLKYIHITGTNGKGSVSAFLTFLLKEAGYSVGTFNSPYLVSFRERILYNNKEIPKKTLVDLANKICQTVDEYNKTSKDSLSLSFFEFTTALMFLYFAQKKPDYVVLEVGLGGRFDATNVVNPVASIVTTISKDHTHLLGNTFLDIAKEKAEIIKPGSFCVTGLIEDPSARDYIQKVCKERNVKIISPDNFRYNLIDSTLKGQTFDFKYNKEYKKLKLSLLGRYQIHNASIALATFLELFPDTPEKTIRKALEKTSWRGRFQVFDRNPLTILDGAHNPDAVKKLAESLETLGIKKPVCLVGAAPNKDISGMAKEFLKISDTFVFTRAKSRGMDKADVKASFLELNPNIAFDLSELPDSFDLARTLAKNKNKTLLVAGSLYLIGEILTLS